MRGRWDILSGGGAAEMPAVSPTPGPADSAPRSVVVHSGSASGQLQVSWWPGSTEPQEYVVDWAGDTEPPEEALTWLRLPAGRHSAMLAGEGRCGLPFCFCI